MTNRIAIACDRKAFEEVFRVMKMRAIILQPKPLKEVRFLKHATRYHS